MSKRIFLHTPEPASSPALYVDELSNALTQCGVPVHIICPANHQSRSRFERNPLIMLHLSAPRQTRTSDGLIGKLWANLRFLLSSCMALVRSVRPRDIVHFQYILHFPFGALFFLCALLRRATIVFTVHDPLPHKFLLPPPLRFLEKRALAYSYRAADVLLVHSDSGKQTLLRHFPDTANKIQVIAHGPYQLAVPLPPTPHSNYLEVLLFGALRENKGAHLAIEAVQQLHREGLPIRLTIAGGVLNRKEQAYWEKCKGTIAECPEPILVVERFISDEDLPELFRNCHCFLLPYTTFTSDSGVAFMALANARPIISTSSGGLGSLLLASCGGVSIKQCTAAAVASALRDAISLGPEHLERLGRAGRAWVLEECGWPKIAAQTRQIYEQFAAATKYAGSYVEQHS